MNAQEIRVNLSNNRVNGSGFYFCERCELIFAQFEGAQICCTSVIPKHESIGSMGDPISEIRNSFRQKKNKPHAKTRRKYRSNLIHLVINP